jgi:3',5'-cyclic-AMP phosphodiesterase
MPTTLVQITDVHLVPEGALLPSGLDPAPPFAAALDAVAAVGADVAALLLTGDLADGGDAASYARLRRMLDPLDVPVLCAAGNHDDRAALREHLLGAPPSAAPLDHVSRIGGLRVVVLDSTVPGHAGGEITPDQLDWLAAELASPAPEGTVLALHHPPLPTPSRLLQGIGLRDPAALGAAIAGSDVRVVLCGHTHVASAGTLAGVPVWVGGPTSSTWYGLTPGGRERMVRAPAVSRIDLWADGLLTSTVPVGGAPVGREWEPGR